jgi:hypothetical protein
VISSSCVLASCKRTLTSFRFFCDVGRSRVSEDRKNKRALQKRKRLIKRDEPALFTQRLHEGNSRYGRTRVAQRPLYFCYRAKFVGNLMC